MARQSDAQKKTMERVLHAYKEGELESGSGDKVTSRRQAIAIGLSEAGASDQQSPTQRRKNRKAAEAREGTGGPTKAELYEKAKRQDVPGRSTMTKAELAKAVS